jgi:hypothetical protein
MAEQLSAQERAKAIVSQYRKDSLPYDIDQWITYAILDANKQGWAEALAACIAKVKRRIQLAQDGGLPGDMQDESLLALVRKDLEQLQPAAKDLEELLREARLEEHKAVCADCNATVEADWPNPTKFKLPKLCQRLAGLEKARAISKGKK